MSHASHRLAESLVRRRSAQLAILVPIVFSVCAYAQERLFPEKSGECSVCTMVLKAPLSPSDRDSINAALRSRQYVHAEALLLAEIQKQPKSSQLLTLLGDIFFLDGKYVNSAVAIKKAEALAPLDNHTRFLLAMCYVIMKHGEWALPELEKLAQADPHNALYVYWISRIDYHDMHLEDAVANAKKAIQIDPNFMQAYNNLGLYEEGLGKYEDAIQSYKTAIRLNDTRGIGSPWPAYNLGKLLSKLGRMDEAETYLKASLKDGPGFPKAHFELGLLLEKKKQDEVAIQELKQAIDGDPSYAEPYYVLGRIYTQMHELEKAQEAFSKFEKLKKQQVGDMAKEGAPHGERPYPY
jgi:tetratricopeptide (TPR) repeat protein